MSTIDITYATSTTPYITSETTPETKHVRIPFEIKNLTEEGTFTAYLSVFDNVDLGGDRIAKGAFLESLQEKGERLIPLLYQHDHDRPIGGFQAFEDAIGLKMEPAFFNLDTQQGREAYSNAKKGILTGFSIGFTVKDSEFDEQTGVRTLTQLELWEGSIVTFPMNPKAQLVDIKKDAPGTERELERFLRDAGFSRSEAKRLVAGGWKRLKSDKEDEREAHNNVSTQLEAINAKLRSQLNGSRKAD